MEHQGLKGDKAQTLGSGTANWQPEVVQDPEKEGDLFLGYFWAEITSAGAFTIPQKVQGNQKQPRNEASSQKDHGTEQEQTRSGAEVVPLPRVILHRHRDPRAGGLLEERDRGLEVMVIWCQGDPVKMR